MRRFIREFIDYNEFKLTFLKDRINVVNYSELLQISNKGMNRYKLQVTGYSYKYFLSTLIRNKIELYYIHEEKNKLIVIVNSDDYKRIKKIKTSCKIRILNRFGMEKVKYLIYKYRYLLLFFLLGLGMIIFLSNIIFTVEVIHPKEEIRELIYNDLERKRLKEKFLVKKKLG